MGLLVQLNAPSTCSTAPLNSMEHSSKNAPCPICERSKDDKCRFNENMIFCYCGDDFRPPSTLEQGDKILALGAYWRLVSFEAGFSDNSYLFIRCNESDLSESLSPLRARRKQRSGEDRLIPWQSEFNQTRRLLHRALAVQEFELLTTERLSYAKDVTEEALDACENLVLKISAYKARMALRKNTITALRIWRKTLQFRLRDIELFEKWALGVPASAPQRPSWLPAEPAPVVAAGTGDDCWF